MHSDQCDNDDSSIFTHKSTSTAPTEWSTEEGDESRADSDVMSVLDSLYVMSYSCLSEVSFMTPYQRGVTSY